jgi:hypothetical protein
MALVVTGCGKKGPPLPPLPRLPAAVSDFTAMRRGETVQLTFVVPATNASGDQPADIATVEVYATTSATPPTVDVGLVPPALTLISSTRVRRPVPPVPAEDAPTVPPLPLEAGVYDQGDRVTVAETLSPALMTPSEPRVSPPAAVAAPRPLDVSLPLVFAAEGAGIKRHYVAVAVSRRGRRGAWSEVRSVPVGAAPAAPVLPTLTFDATTLTLSWTPGPGARVAGAPEGEVLEARPLGPAVVVTRYNVYAAPAAQPLGEAAQSAVSAPLNPSPTQDATLAMPGVVFGTERCFVVRAVDAVDGVDIEGPASPAACVTPRDTFPPAAPAALEAVGGVDLISLIWDRVDEPDVAGYLVFRGPAGADPTMLLTPEPITASSFEDRRVTPGARYVYAVVAVDSATPANRSGPSNLAEAATRQ